MQSHPKQVSYQTIGSNKDRPRLWIEGIKLGVAGFVRGASYRVVVEEDRVRLVLDPNGTRRVSGKSRSGQDIPVLDIQISALTTCFGTGARVRVAFTEGQIAITLHHEERRRRDREADFRTALAAGRLTEASLFTGGGVSTLAIHQAISDSGQSGHLAWIVDAELKYLQVGFSNNYAITDETVALVGRIEEIEPGYFKPVNILSFSMPCAGFSRAGKSKHRKDPECHDSATALFGTVAAIRSANPAVLISENVPEARTSPAYALLKAELIRLGYSIFERIMDSSDTATIENRKRYWLVGISEGISDGYAFTMTHPEVAEGRPRIADILDRDIPESAWSHHAYLEAKAARDTTEGKGFSRQLLTGTEQNCGTIGRHYNKRRSTEPFLTREDGLERLFTPPEHARLKSVPDYLVRGIAPTLGHEILGQSVDFRQAYVAMASILAFLGHTPVTETGLTCQSGRDAHSPASPGDTPARLQKTSEQLSLF